MKLLNSRISEKNLGLKPTLSEKHRDTKKKWALKLQKHGQKPTAGGADFVWANEANQEVYQALVDNVASVGNAGASMVGCEDLLPEWAAPARCGSGEIGCWMMWRFPAHHGGTPSHGWFISWKIPLK